MSFLNIVPEEKGKPKKKKPRNLVFGITIIAAIATLGPTLASNISLNDGSKVEFGQGISSYSACDSEILVTPLSTFVNGTPGEFKFSGLQFSGVDTTDQAGPSKGCAGKYFIFRLFQENNDTVLATYTLAVRSNGTFISEDGDITTQNPATESSSGTLNFTSATISASNVYRFTFESRVLTSCYGQGGSPDGLSECSAAPSGYYLAQNFPSYSSGTYWIQSDAMPEPLEMYVDMTEDGGGYDFYFVTSGPSFSFVTDANGGTPLGLDFVMPRSKYHWRAMQNAVLNHRPAGNFGDYFTTSYGIYRNTNEYGSNFVSTVMNSDSATPAWRVKDGGRWWLRDTTYSEPNGDYDLNGLLAGYSMSEGWNLEDLYFNDGGAAATGNYYLVSTNANP